MSATALLRPPSPARLGLLVFALSYTSAGQVPSPSASGPSATQAGGKSAAPCNHANSLAAIACELASQLSLESRNLRIAIAPAILGLDDPGSKNLGRKLGKLTAGRISGASFLGSSPEGEALQSLSSGERLLYLEASFKNGNFLVSATLYPLRPPFWRRSVLGQLPTNQAFVSRPMDAQLSSYFPRVPLVVTTVTKITSPVGKAVALACGDTDGDGASELLIVGRHMLHSGRIRNGRFVPLATRTWDELSEIAPSPLQDPIATAEVLPGGGAQVGTTDRKDSVVLNGKLELLERRPGHFPWPALGCTARQELGLAPTISSCHSSHVLFRPAITETVDAIAGATLAQGEGLRHIYMTRRLGGSVVEAEDDAGQRVQLQHAGAQLAAGDLNRDGTPELLTTVDTLDPSADHLRVHTWGKQQPSIELPVPAGIDALAVCPPEGSGLAPVAIASGTQLWIIQ